ncbi:MAG: DUF2721 domain-containing protein [Acidobacteriia bacterium]|nr:DUF2721 domain-containing protein [Terriglobia bacterium]
MLDISRLFQAFVAPAIFVSAAALLVLSLNVRLMGMVTRLRQFQHERHVATVAERMQEAEALGEQIISIEKRAEMIRRAILLTLLSLTGTILSCLLLGLGLSWNILALLAVAVFVASILCMLGGTVYYLAEILVALSSVREEAKYYHFMDLGRRAGDYRREGAREDWQRPH